MHVHNAAEPLPEFQSLDEPLLHMSRGHGMLIGPVGKTIESLAPAHAA
jgi:hypothetical protein